MVGRIDVEADNVADIRLECRIPGHFERLDPVQLQPVLAQDIVHNGEDHPHPLRQGPQRPVTGMRRRRRHRERDQGLHPVLGYRRPARRTGGVVQKAVDGDHLIEPERQIRAVRTLNGKLADKRRCISCDLGVAWHQEIDDDIYVGPVVPSGDDAHELKAPQIVPLMVVVFLEGFDKLNVFAVAQCGRIEAEVDVSGADMEHVGVAQQQPGNGAADDRKFAFEATEDLADLDEYGLNRCCCPVIVVTGGLGFPYNHEKHFAAICSAASRSRSLPFHRSR